MNQFGFHGSYSSVRRLAQKLKKQHPQATCILDFAPGEAAQVDFGKGPTITDVFTGEVIPTWIFVMTLCFSRHMYAEIVTNQKVETWLACHRRAFEYFNGVPAKLIIDNPKCAITRACFRDPEVQRSYGELAEGYGFLISPCPPADPEKKGRVEAGVKYVKNRFVPLRHFRSLTDANAQLKQWVMETAGNRIHGTTKQKPLTLFAEGEKHLLRRLPDVPVQIAAWTQLKLHGDCHVHFEKAFYSAPFPLGASAAVAQGHGHHASRSITTWSWWPFIPGCGNPAPAPPSMSICRRRRSPTRCRTLSGACARPKRSVPTAIG